MLCEFGQFYMHTGSKSCAEVRWTGQHVAEMLIPHKLVTVLGNQVLYLLQPIAESLEDLQITQYKTVRWKHLNNIFS